VESLDKDSVRNYHRRAFSPRGTAIAVVGGMADFNETVDIIGEAFGAWEDSAADGSQADLALTNATPVRETTEIAGKSQADLAVGITTVPRNHDDYYALDVSNLILGRLGLMGRLGAEVRDRQGLAYYAYSQIEPRTDGSLWAARAGVDPANVERALEATLAELRGLRDDRVSEQELRDAKNFLVGVLPLALETHDGVAAMLLAIEEFGLGLDYLERYPEIIASITREQVLQAARQHLDPDRVAIGIAGP
jgi:zinc protease